MKLSIIIPAYNEEQRIPLCLKSIQDELSSGVYATEVIVVNNASTDRTKEVAQSFPFVHVIDEPQKGIVWARRAGFLASSGDLIANIDADTMLPSGWIHTVFTEFEKDESLCALSGPFIYYDSSLMTRFITKFFYVCGYVINFFTHLFSGTSSLLQGGNFVVRRDALLKIGGYDTTIEFYGEDTDIGRRISRIGKVTWTFSLPMYASGRRLNTEGVLMTGIRYALNFFWITFLKKPFTHTHNDIRHDNGHV